ncbi:hypothetical protein AB9F41_36905, partial [Rhizobium leguminosarum]|uniref:hypothetical protein n=1 Tax=Rhizobium leguminosarum TaxID=384 RepID=UPI003F94CB01
LIICASLTVVDGDTVNVAGAFIDKSAALGLDPRNQFFAIFCHQFGGGGKFGTTLRIQLYSGITLGVEPDSDNRCISASHC